MSIAGRILLSLSLLLIAPLALAGPDLVVSVELVKGSFDEDSGTVPVTYYISIANIGDEACSGGFYADFWPLATCSSCIPSSDCGEGTAWDPDAIPELQPGGEPYVLTETEDVFPNVLPYRYLFYVDSVFNFCAEDDESNNVACAEFEVHAVEGEADLALSNCLVEPSLFDASKMEFSADIVNVGSAPSEKAVNVEFFLDKLGDDFDAHVNQLGQGFALVPAGLEPQQKVTVKADVDCPAALHQGACVANVFNEVEEPDYGNNFELANDSTSFLCVEAANNPDLEVLSYTADLAGGTPYFTGVMANNGTVDILPGENFKIGIWFNKPGGPDIKTCPDVNAGEGWVLNHVSGFEKGAEANFGYGSPPLPNGFYESWVLLDCDDEILEMNEKNNRETDDMLIDVSGPDLLVKDGSWELHEDKGFDVPYTIWVENAGTEEVDGFDVDIFWDVDEPPTWQDAGKHKGLYERFEEVLHPGDVRQIPFNWDPPDGIPQGIYHTCVVLDITNEIHETVESNNTFCLDVEVPEYIDGLPNLTIENFVVKPTGNTAHFLVEIRNTGVKPVTTPFHIQLFTDQVGQPIMGDLGDLSYEVVDMEVDEVVQWPVDVEGLADGEYRAYVLIDSANVVEEAVEGDNLAGPRIYVICSSCDACPQGVYVTNPSGCICGNNTVNYGFCCDDEWYAVGCPSGTVEGAEDAFSPEAVVVEFGGEGFGVPGENCGCRMTSPRPRSLGGIALLLTLCALLLGGVRRVRCDRVAH